MDFKQKRSEHTDEQIQEAISRIHLEQCIIGRGWKFRELPHDNDIDAEIEIFETFLGGVSRQTSAKFLKAQLKSTAECKVSDNGLITYHCPVKFLNFSDECDIPVLLFLYDVKNKRSFWLWTQSYIYNVLDVEKPDWRSNKSTVVVRFKEENQVSDESVFFEHMQQIASRGISEISLMRRYKDCQEYYRILEESDSSTGTARRVTAWVLVDKFFSESKDAVRFIIRRIVQDLKQTDFYRSEITRNHYQGQEADVVFVFLYDDIDQKNYGLPFCRAQWRNEERNDLLSIFEPDEILDGISVIWDRTLIPKSFILDNTKSLGEYVQFVDEIYGSYQRLVLQIRLLVEVRENGKISYERFIAAMTREIKPELDDMFNRFSNRGFAPHQCKDMDSILRNAISLLHNVGVIVVDNERHEENVLYMVELYLRDSSNEIATYPYFRNKIR